MFIDDATGKLMALYFCDGESTFNYFAACRQYLERHGKPVALYSDKASVFRATAANPRGGDGFTQFGRAMGELTPRTPRPARTPRPENTPARG